MKTAVVVPVKNESRGLKTLLDALLEQLSEGDEIIVVDAGSTDGTREILEEYASKDPRTRFLLSPGAYPGKGRNTAIESTDADLIAQIDGGNLPNHCWLEELRRPIEEGRADYVTGNSQIMPQYKKILGVEVDINGLYGATLFRGAYLRYPTDPEGKDENSVSSPAGGDSVAYRKEIWVRAGGFPHWMRYGSDPIFVRKVKQQKPRFAFAQKAVSYWQIGPSPARVLERHIRQQMSWFRTPQRLTAFRWRLAVYASIMVFAGLSPFFTMLWTLPAALFLVVTVQQGVKTLKTYRVRTHPTPAQLQVAAMILPFLESACTLAKLAGTVRGMLLLLRGTEQWTSRVEEYLS